jgi:hypothetical protein
MDQRPAFHCGATDCCEGVCYPECQADLTLTAEAAQQSPTLADTQPEAD